MPKFLTNGALAVCDRCKQKKLYVDLHADGNSPGLRVCDKCNDLIDPWRLSPRVSEDVSLRFARPEAPLE